MTRYIHIIAVIFFTLATQANAELYKYIDENGTIVFTDDILKVPDNKRSKVNKNRDLQSDSNNSGSLEQKIKRAYLRADYSAAAKLLAKQIQDLRNTLEEDKRSTFNVYQKSFILAHIYAWRLDRLEKALAIYREIIELKRSSEEVNKNLAIELLFIGEIYERKGESSKAVEYHNRLLNDLIAMQEEAEDDASFFIGGEFMKFIKYRIDGINLKVHGKGGFEPLLDRLKLSSADAVVQLLIGVLAPESMYGYSEAMADLPNHIKRSPKNIGSMAANYTLAVQASAGEVDESSEETLNAYLARYPESYYSLSLRYLFYRYYMDNGELEKAKILSR